MGGADTTLFVGLLGAMAMAGSSGGNRAREQVAAEFACDRYMRPGGIETAIGDLAVAERVAPELNSNPLGRALIGAAIGGKDQVGNSPGGFMGGGGMRRF